MRAAAGRFGSTASKAAIRSPEIERARDERDREHDGDLRERDREPERRELVAEEPEPAERGEQPDSGHGGREHERQLDQRDCERPASKPARRDRVRRGSADEQDQEVGDRARLDGHEQRVDGGLAPHPGEEVAGRNPEEDRQDGEQEEPERERRREHECCGKETAHGSPKPARASSRRPSTPRRSATSSKAPARFLVPFTTATS